MYNRLRNDLTKFIQENLLQKDPTPIGPEDSLIDSGIINSMGLIRLVSFIETRTGVRIPAALITPDNFETVTAIERTIDEVRHQRGVRRRAAGPAARDPRASQLLPAWGLVVTHEILQPPRSPPASRASHVRTSCPAMSPRRGAWHTSLSSLS